MNGLTKIILIALFIILLVMLVSHYHQTSRRMYSKRQQMQMKTIHREMQEHLQNALMLSQSQPLAAFQQSCYAASQIDALKRLAPEEDLENLLGSNLDMSCESVQDLQLKLWQRLKKAQSQ